jgi:hypothetical protein
MKFTPMIENEYCTVLVIALYEGGAEQGESNVVREEEDGLSTQHSAELARALAAVATGKMATLPGGYEPNVSRKGHSKRARGQGSRGGATV